METAAAKMRSEESLSITKIPSTTTPAAEQPYQLSFFQLDDPVLGQIRSEITDIDINSLTPLEALNKLNEIKKALTGKSN